MWVCEHNYVTIRIPLYMQSVHVRIDPPYNWLCDTYSGGGFDKVQ